MWGKNCLLYRSLAYLKAGKKRKVQLRITSLQLREEYGHAAKSKLRAHIGEQGSPHLEIDCR
jgi:hypothetical protein